MKLYQLYSRQILPVSQQEAWEFLSNPSNLKVITPDHMGFDILSGADRGIFPGQIIHCKVSPFSGYTTKWITEITHVKDGEYFVDEQRFGPYSLWHHKHFLKSVEGGVEMEDIIDYKLPFGLLGRIIHPLLIKKQLLRIFSYREQKLTKLFGTLPGTSAELQFKLI